MKKIIPFKKDIIFKSKISEITSISLEHTLQVEDDNTISGKFIVSGDYRLTDTSINTESFNYELPFLVNIDERYILDNVLIDVDDFYYEIINENILSVNIEVLIDKLEEVLIKKENNIEEIEESEVKSELIKEDEAIIELDEEELEDEALMGREQIKEDILMTEEKIERCIEEEDIVPSNLTSLFDNMDNSNETFKSYTVYIMREGDTIETLIEKYKVTKEELLDYNDLTEIKLGDKIIIPSNDSN